MGQNGSIQTGLVGVDWSKEGGGVTLFGVRMGGSKGRGFEMGVNAAIGGHVNGKGLHAGARADVSFKDGVTASSGAKAVAGNKSGSAAGAAYALSSNVGTKTAATHTNFLEAAQREKKRAEDDVKKAAEALKKAKGKLKEAQNVKEKRKKAKKELETQISKQKENTNKSAKLKTEKNQELGAANADLVDLALQLHVLRIRERARLTEKEHIEDTFDPLPKLLADLRCHDFLGNFKAKGITFKDLDQLKPNEADATLLELIPAKFSRKRFVKFLSKRKHESAELSALDSKRDEKLEDVQKRLADLAEKVKTTDKKIDKIERLIPTLESMHKKLEENLLKLQEKVVESAKELKVAEKALSKAKEEVSKYEGQLDAAKKDVAKHTRRVNEEKAKIDGHHKDSDFNSTLC